MSMSGKLFLLVLLVGLINTCAPALAKQIPRRAVKLGDMTVSVNDNKKQYPLFTGKESPVTIPCGISDFNTLEIDAPVTIEITGGDSLACTLTGRADQLDLIVVEMKGETLSVSMRKRVQFEKEQPVKLVISQPGDGPTKLDIGRDARILLHKSLHIPSFSLRSTDAAVEIECPDIETGNVEIKSSGACLITMKGTADFVVIDGSGVCIANLSELKASDVVCNVSGVARCNIYAAYTLKARISGTGSIVYLGNPEQVSKQILGLGSISGGN